MTGQRRLISLSLRYITLVAALMFSQHARPEDVTQYLNAKLLTGGLIEPPCVPVSSFRPVEQGFDDVAYALLPGAHRMVLANSNLGWRMVEASTPHV